MTLIYFNLMLSVSYKISTFAYEVNHKLPAK